MRINHRGFVSYNHSINRVGTGNIGGRIVFSNDNAYLVTTGSEYGSPCMLLNDHELWVKGTVDTDLNYLYKMKIALRSLP